MTKIVIVANETLSPRARVAIAAIAAIAILSKVRDTVALVAGFRFGLAIIKVVLHEQAYQD